MLAEPVRAPQQRTRNYFDEADEYIDGLLFGFIDLQTHEVTNTVRTPEPQPVDHEALQF
jgi:hypothetical protein